MNQSHSFRAYAVVVGTDITSDADDSVVVELADMNGDGNLDLVVGNEFHGSPQINRLYLNNGTTDPFSGVMGTNITDLITTAPLVIRSVTLPPFKSAR